MNFIKNTLKSHPKRRFEIYDPFTDLTKPHQTGLFPNETEYYLSTPNLERCENITLVASNSTSKEAVLVQLKWRPDDNIASLLSRLVLVVDGCTYEYEHIESYEPKKCPRNRITQYGSSGSRLKLFITCPYRRSRLLFIGQMRKKDTAEVVFVKLNLVCNTLSQVFDFIDEYNPELYKTKRSHIDSLLHDRHEYKIRLNGDLLVVEANGTKTKREIALWGFHAKQFLEQDKKVKTKRICSYVNSGQAFHIGTIKNQDTNDEIDFGYTGFEIIATTAPIDKPFRLDWNKINSETENFEFEVSGQNKTYTCSAKRRVNTEWFDVVMNDKPGWAWVSFDDKIIDSELELQMIEENRNERLKAIDAGLLISPNVTVDKSNEPVLVSLIESDCSSSELVGSKASSLAALHSFSDKTNDCHYKVPFAIVLTRFAYDLVSQRNNHLQQGINELQHLLTSEGHESIRDECKKLEKLVEDTKLPQEIYEKLGDLLKAHYGEEGIHQACFAVRSSSWGEDEEDMSAAGQLNTLLNVKGLESIERAIMACIASKFSYENVEYKRQHGLPLSLPMAVVIQEMVQCQKAGVMFTCEPTTGDDSLFTITANFGLGESVVSGQSDPDSIVVRVQREKNELKIEQIHVGQKQIVIAAEGLDENQLDRSKCCLSDEEILSLARCGLSVERFFGSGARDIEWGLRDGQMYLFQSRPVTGLESYSTVELMNEYCHPTQAEANFLTRANIGEVMPYAVKPFTLTYTIFNWCVDAAKLYMRLTPGAEYIPYVSNDMFYDKYHSFFNLRCSPFMAATQEEDEKPVMVKAMEIGLFGHEMPPCKDIIEASKGFTPPTNFFEGMRFNWVSLPLRLAPVRTITKEKTVMRRLRQEVLEHKLARGYEENKMVGLYNQILELLKVGYHSWENHIFIIIFSNMSNIPVLGLLSKYINDPLKLFAALTKFLAISPDVISAEIPARVEKMAQLIKSDGQENRFIEMSNDEALEYLKSSTNKELVMEFETFIERFGHRCYCEFELASTPWRDDPVKIVEMVKKNCVASEPKSDTKKGPATVDEVIDSLGVNLSFVDRLMLKYFIVPRCQLMVNSRERTKDVLIEYSDVMRIASRMLADELCKNLRLPDKELFYYVYFDELELLIRDHQPSIVMQATRRRNMFQKVFSTPWKFEEIIRDVVPNHMLPTKELDESIKNAPKLFGTPASSGRVQGKVCLVQGYHELHKVTRGSILLTHSTDIGFSPVFPLLSGIITEVGGLISHGAVVAREYGLPSVLGIPDVTRIIADGEEIILDADNGTIIRLLQ